MTGLLEIVASNCVVALALAVVVAGISRLRVNPNVVHVLWLMVLVKFFTPPIWQVDLAWPQTPRESLVEEVEFSAEPQVLVAVEPASIPPAPEAIPAPAMDWPEALLVIWAIGVVMLIGITLVRVWCFRALLRKATPAPLELVQLAENLCRRLGVARCPEVLLLPVRISPAVWSLSGRPRILIPSELAREMNAEQLETILAHELAHIRRGDHLVRLLELAVTTLFWWNPVVWWVRRNLREMEEHCCDALVLETLPDSARRYAIALIETVEFLSNQSGRLPIGATAAKPTVTLTRRIQMLKHGHHVKRLSAKGLIAMLAALTVPMTLAFAQDDSKGTELKTKVYRLKDLDVDAVEKTILEKVAPGEWDKTGGPNTIKQTSKGLVITAGPEVHQQVALVLELQRLIKRQAELERQLEARYTERTKTARVNLNSFELTLSDVLNADPSASKAHADLQHHEYLRTRTANLGDQTVMKSCTECHSADVHHHPAKSYHPHPLPKLGSDSSAYRAMLEVFGTQQAPKKFDPKAQEKPNEGGAAIEIHPAEVHVYGLPSKAVDAEIYFYDAPDLKDPRRIRYRLVDPKVAPDDLKSEIKESPALKAARLKPQSLLGIELRTGKTIQVELDYSQSLKEHPKKPKE